MKCSLYLWICLFALTSCGCGSTFLGATTSPKGTREQQIQYHKNQIKKYISLVNQEEQQAERSLTRRDMLEVRQANQRKAKYLEKIEEHTKELERLRRGEPAISEPAVSLALIAGAPDVNDADELTYLNHQIESLTELKNYYVAKSARMRNRASRLQYQNMTDEAEKMFQEADNYDEIVKKIDEELSQLEAKKQKLQH